ncbi:MAG: hypothetical protein AAF585_25625, partial [Verrucomicrobiota bacterium]
TNAFVIPNDLPPIKQIEAGWTHVLCLAEDGSVFRLGSGDPTVLPAPDEIQSAVSIRARGPVYAAQLTGGKWRAWGPNMADIVTRVNAIENASRITFKGNRWNGVFWIEPNEG